MALLFCDSFDPYSQATGLASKWTTNSSASIVAGGRNGQGAQMGFLSKTTVQRAAFSIGWAAKGSLGGGGGFWGGQPYQLAAVNISRTIDILFQLQMFGNGTFGLYAGNVLFGNPLTFVATSDVWCAIGLDIVLSDGAAGKVNVAAKLYVNGALLFSGNADSNVTKADLISGSSMANYHTFSAITTGTGTTVLDDVFILDANVVDAAEPNAQYTDVGDVGIFAIYPKTDVDTNWTASSGTNRANMVKEHPPDGDTSYIFDDTVGDVQTFLFDLVAPFTGQIKGAQLSIYARKDDEGSRAIVDCANSGAFVGATNFYLGDSYYYHTFPYNINPATGTPFTVANTNAADFGVKLAV